jgi:hypothetical protein
MNSQLILDNGNPQLRQLAETILTQNRSQHKFGLTDEELFEQAKKIKHSLEPKFREWDKFKYDLLYAVVIHEKTRWKNNLWTISDASLPKMQKVEFFVDVDTLLQNLRDSANLDPTKPRTVRFQIAKK